MKTFLKGLVQKAENGDIIVVASDDSKDRAGDVIDQASWDLTNFNASPRMFVDHDYSVRSLTGIWKNVRVENGKLKMTPVFHEITELARVNKEMVEKGWLNTVSVGYIPHKDRNELLEVSWVGVPCNANARVERLSIKDIDGSEADQIEQFVKDETPAPEAKPEAEAPAPVAEPVPAPVEEPKPAESAPVEAPAEEKKGLIDDVNAGNQGKREEKWPMIDAAFYAFDKFCCAFMSDATDPSQFAPMIDDLCASLIVLKDAALPEAMDDDAMMLRVQETMQKFVNARVTKAGRVLSAANRGTIETAIDAMESGTGALKDLLASIDSEEGAGKGVGKVEEKSVPGTSAASKTGLDEFILLRRVMQETNTLTSDFLAHARKQMQAK